MCLLSYNAHNRRYFLPMVKSSPEPQNSMCSGFLRAIYFASTSEKWESDHDSLLTFPWYNCYSTWAAMIQHFCDAIVSTGKY
jgi:hypothetical protein